MNVKLVVIQGKPAGKTLQFPTGEFFMGRGPECQVRFNSDWVSRQHCALRVTLEAAFLRYMGSRNGTLVNGALLAGEQQLHPGDHVQLGPVVFEVIFEYPGVESPAEGLSRPIGQDGDDDEEGPPLDSTAHHPLWPSS